MKQFAVLADDTAEAGRTQRGIGDALSLTTLCAHPASAVQVLIL